MDQLKNTLILRIEKKKKKEIVHKSIEKSDLESACSNNTWSSTMRLIHSLSVLAFDCRRSAVCRKGWGENNLAV